MAPRKPCGCRENRVIYIFFLPSPFTSMTLVAPIFYLSNTVEQAVKLFWTKTEENTWHTSLFCPPSVGSLTLAGMFTALGKWEGDVYVLRHKKVGEKEDEITQHSPPPLFLCLNLPLFFYIESLFLACLQFDDERIYTSDYYLSIIRVSLINLNLFFLWNTESCFSFFQLPNVKDVEWREIFCSFSRGTSYNDMVASFI